MNPIINYIYFENKIYKYSLTFSIKVKGIIAKVNDNCQINVKANPLIDEKSIHKFIENNISKLVGMIERKNNSNRFNIFKNSLNILGEEKKIYIERAIKNEKFSIINNKIYLYLNSIENKEKVIRKLLKKESEKYIIPRAIELAQKFNFPSGRFQIKWLTATWGSCYKNQKLITFSSRLVMHPKEIIDYVIIHELSHLIEANHSDRFWNIVGSILPNYKVLRKALKY